MPDGVTKARSTTTGVDVGFRSEMSKPFAPAVLPIGKYHDDEVVETQGVTDHPVDPWTSSLTATPPPEIVTISDSHDPDVGEGREGTTWPRAGMATAVRTEVPASVTSVMEPVAARVVVLVRRMLPTAAPDAVD